MTRFKKEMAKRFPILLNDDDMQETHAYTVDRLALIVFDHPSIITILQFLPNGKQREVPEWEYPEISAPYLVHLCGGDVERAREIIKKQPSF